jgi:hypothetical protein
MVNRNIKKIIIVIVASKYKKNEKIRFISTENLENDIFE